MANLAIDWDDHPEVVRNVCQQVSRAIAAQLREMSTHAKEFPKLTPEQALLDAALAVERAMVAYLRTVDSMRQTRQ